MKKYFAIIVCTFSIIHSMEEQSITVTREPREWNPEDYMKGNQSMEDAALKFLRESLLNLENKDVLDIGCGTGNITHKIASSAHKVHGFDASKQMINFAQNKYQDAPTISWQHSFAEDFQTTQLFDTACMFFCFHWFQDQEQAIKQINKALKMNGDFFGTVHTANNPEPLNLQVALEIIPGLEMLYTFLKQHNIIKNAECTCPTDEQFHTLLEHNGFSFISYERKEIDAFTFKTREDLADQESAIINSRPFMKKLPEFMRKAIFDRYLDIFLTKLNKNESGDYIYPAVETTVFHAYKNADLG